MTISFFLSMGKTGTKPLFILLFLILCWRKATRQGTDVEFRVVLPSASNIRGMSRCFSATSKAVLRFSIGLSCVNRSMCERDIYHLILHPKFTTQQTIQFLCNFNNYVIVWALLLSLIIHQGSVVLYFRT